MTAKKYAEIQFRHCGGLWTDKDPAEYRLLFRLYRHGPVSERHRRRPHDEVEEARLRRRQADPAGAAQHQLLPARGARRSIRRSPSRRSSPANGALPSRRPRPRTRWPTRAPTSSPAMSTARRWSSRRRPAAAPMSAATTPTRARWRRRNISPAPNGTGARSTPSSSTTMQAGKPLPNFVRGGMPEGFVKMSPLGPAVTPEAREAVRTATRPRS